MELKHSRSDVRRDVAVAVAFFVVGSVMYVANLRYFFGSAALIDVLPRWMPLFSLAVACGFQMFRSSRPAVAVAGGLFALALDALCGPTIAVWIVYSDIIYAAAIYATGRVNRAMLLSNWLIAAVTLTVSLTVSGDWRVALFAMILVVALIVSPASYGQAIRQHQIAADSERDRAQAVAALAVREQEAAVAFERRQFARDLHDVVAGQLSGIAMQSAAALDTTDPAIRATVLRSVRAASLDALGEMRAMIEVLTGTDDLDPPATANLNSLDRLIDSARASGSAVTADLGVVSVARMTGIAGYRIVAQAITNAVTHSPRSPIDIVVGQHDSTVKITVSNPVPAGTEIPARAGGHGLNNMEMRARSVGGTCHAGMADNRWVVQCELPCATLASAQGSR
ncbi:sensor histidine kinase [Williamsia sp.]|uniref:sensor histidine kinase n=1 Tax=Williamsia sp. TaxID=1872085 RepID=UPI002F92F7E2